jgi:potassium-dependent mechanosensitive channel
MADRNASLTVFPFRIRWAATARLTLLVTALSLLMTSPGSAQWPQLLPAPAAENKGTGQEVPAASPEEQRKFVVRALADARAERNRIGIVPPGLSKQDLDEQARLLGELIGRLDSQLQLFGEREEVWRARASAEQQAQRWTGFREPAPYSVFFVDDVQKQLQAARAAVRDLESAQDLFAQQIATARESVKRAEVQERLAGEKLELARTPEARSEASWRKQLAATRTRAAAAGASWGALRYEVLGERLATAKVTLSFQERQWALAGKGLVFTRADLNKGLAELGTSRAALEEELNAASTLNSRSVNGLVQAQQELDAFSAHPGSRDITRAKLLRKEFEDRQLAAQAWVESSRFEIEAISALIHINQSLASWWEKRYAATLKSGAERVAAPAEFRKGRDQLRPWLEYAQRKLKACQSAEREQEAGLSSLDAQSPRGRAERDIHQARSLQSTLAERMVDALGQLDDTLQSWQEEISLTGQSRSLSQRLRDMTALVAGVAGKVWSFELFAVEDSVEVAGQKVVTSRGVTVGKSVGALLLFLAGYWLSVVSSRRVQRVMVERFAIGAHQANVIRRWLLALTTFILLVVTLNLARIPLTVFAFLGGALAIGVGFGTQNLIKNLISGILILLERKVVVGDIIDVDGVVGKVTAVDIRASTVLGFDGVETMIPNSIFLEQKVTNWTYSNARLRRSIRVGVAYGSPATRVRDILGECAERHGQVLKKPQAQVCFDDFGDNSLIFVVYYWLDYGPEVDPMRVASDLRFMIEQCFAQEGIVMAFPQRDLHFDNERPLRVEVVAASAPAGSCPGTPLNPCDKLG